jgi:hypothetical protein
MKSMIFSVEWTFNFKAKHTRDIEKLRRRGGWVGGGGRKRQQASKGEWERQTDRLGGGDLRGEGGGKENWCAGKICKTLDFWSPLHREQQILASEPHALPWIIATLYLKRFKLNL